MTDHLCVELVPIFNHLQKNEMEEIMDVSKYRKLKKNEVLFLPGDKAEMLYIIASGEIHLSTINENGKELLTSVKKSGDFIGELSILNKGFQETLAVAKKESELCTISFEDFQQILLKHPDVSIKILQELSSRLQESQYQTLMNSTSSVQERVANYLVANEGRIKISKKDLASYLGTTPESISRILTQFEEDGYVRKKSANEFELLKEFDS